MLGLAILTRNHSASEIVKRYHDVLCKSENEFAELNERLKNDDKIFEVIK